MTESRKLSIPVEVDSTGAKQGFGEVKAAAQDMAQAVGQAGAAAAKGVDGIGAGAVPATQKLDAATRSIVGSIQRTTAVMEAGGKTSAKYFEVLAQQRGVSPDVLKPYLDQLRQVEVAQKAATAAQQASAGVTGAAAKQLNAYGQSAAQTAAALRQVPAQVTDIITSLQGGQAPLTVLLQQGGQLRDTFGGIAPAAKALGGAVLSMINPLTLGVAAVGALALGALQGSKELREFQNVATSTGNAIGLSSSQFEGLRDSLVGVAGTKGAAAEALTEIARSGKIAGDSVKAIAEAAILMEKATGQAVSKTVAEFAKLADAPVTASLELNKQYGFLTTAVFEQIRALEEQGKRLQATELATTSLAEVTKMRAASIVENAGLIERGWRGVLGAVKQVVDATSNIGRGQSLAQQLADVNGEIAAASGQDRNRRFRGPFDESLNTLRQRQSFLQEQLRLEQRGAELAGERRRVEQSGIAAAEAVAKANEKAATKQEQLNKALKQYRDDLAAIRTANPGSALLDPKQIAATEASIRDSFKEKAGGRGEDTALANLRARVQAEQSYVEQLKARGVQADKLNDGEKLVLQLQEQLKGKLDARTRSATELQLVEAQRLAALGKEAEFIRDRAKLEEKLAEQQAKALGVAYSAADATEDLADKQENANRVFGQGRAALLDLTIAQLEKTRADLEATDNVIPGYIDAINKQIEATKRLRDAQATGEGLEAGKKAADETAREWKRAAESINDSLTDALLRGFESGKSFAQNLRDTLANMFRTLVLQPTIKGILAPVSGALGGIGQAFAGQATGGGSGLLGSLGSFGSTGASLAAGLGTFGGGLSAGFGGLTGSIGGLFGAAGTGATFGGALSAGSTALAAGNIAGGLGTLAGALGPVALGALALYSLTGKKGGPKTESGFGSGVVLRGDPSNSKAVVDAIQAEYRAIIKASGGTDRNLALGVFSAADPAGDSLTQLQVRAAIDGEIISDRARDRGFENVDRSPEALQAAIAEEMQRVTLAALRESDVAGLLGQYLEDLGDVSKLALADVTTALEKVRKASGERQALQDRLTALTTTEVERLTKAREAERAVIDETNLLLLNQIYATEDLKIAEGNLLTAYGNESSQLTANIEAHRAYAKELRAFRDGLLLGDRSPLTAAQKLPVASQQFAATAAKAAAGDQAARASLTGAADAYLSAALNGAGSRAEYEVIFAEVSASLTTAAAGAESQATIAEQQLAEMKSQLAALNLLNGTVQTFAQAWAAYAGAQKALEQAKAAATARTVAQIVAPAVQAVTAAPSEPEWRISTSYADSNPFAGNGFATGGAFTNGIVSRPTMFNIGEMGEGGESEAILPLANVRGKLGVRALSGGGGELAALMREVLAEMKQARSEGRMEAAASVTELGKLAKMVKRWDVVGTPPVREEVSA